MPESHRAAGPAGGSAAGGGASAWMAPTAASDRTSSAPTRRVPASRFPAGASNGSHSNDTSPKRRVAPGLSATSPTTRSFSTNEPLVDPTSLNTQMSSRRCSLAWLVLTLGSGRTTSL